jgi:hypothetical protein
VYHALHFRLLVSSGGYVLVWEHLTGGSGRTSGCKSLGNRGTGPRTTFDPGFVLLDCWLFREHLHHNFLAARIKIPLADTFFVQDSFRNRLLLSLLLRHPRSGLAR